ncbi:helix-turn-helix transcriptional regulator [Bacillus thuringiensis]|nr:helix-turn-helix transcriptional regulator [Bacillus thuringiensis]
MTVIRNIRESKGLTIQELSEASEIPVKTLYHIETGTKGVIENRAKLLANIFNEPIENLFFCYVLSSKIRMKQISLTR